MSFCFADDSIYRLSQSIPSFPPHLANLCLKRNDR
jgi:hypothetical protein